MTSTRKANDDPHSTLPTRFLLLCRDYDRAAAIRHKIRAFRENSTFHCGEMNTPLPTFPKFASVLLSLCVWGRSCVQFRLWNRGRRGKSNDQSTGTATKWSARFFPKSLQRFGRRTRPQTSLPSVDAACVRLNDTLVASEIGLAMLSQPSLPKF